MLSNKAQKERTGRGHQTVISEQLLLHQAESVDSHVCYHLHWLQHLISRNAAIATQCGYEEKSGNIHLEKA